MNRHRAKVSRKSRQVAAHMHAYGRAMWEKNVEPECSTCDDHVCQRCNALRWHDEDLEQEFWFQVERFSPLVQERAGRLCGMRVYDPFSLPR